MKKDLALIKINSSAKIIAILVLVVLYWIFVYYPYHYFIYTPISGLVVAGACVVYGFYCFFIEKSVRFDDVRIVSYLISAMSVIMLIFVNLAITKHGLSNNVDIMLTFFRDYLGMSFAYVGMVIAWPCLLFVGIATYRIIGKEHIYLWVMLFLAWLASNVKLLINFVLH